MHLDTYEGNQGAKADDAKKDPEPKPAPTIMDVVTEDPRETVGRFWGWCTETHRPLPLPENMSSPEIMSPPWGAFDLKAIMKDRVPISMVGAGLIYFNAARYNAEKFEGLLSMMELKDLPRGEYVYFTETSQDPLADGFLTQWRFVSAVAYQKYLHRNMAMDKRPERKKSKRSMIKQFERLISDEMKQYGKGKKVKPPKKIRTADDEEQRRW